MDIMINVVNHYHLSKQDFAGTEYVGRGSPLGNPYSHMTGTKATHVVATVQEAIESYRAWLMAQIRSGNQEVIDELDRLAEIAMSTGRLNLRCYCAPKPCHGQVIREVILEAIQASSST